MHFQPLQCYMSIIAQYNRSRGEKNHPVILLKCRLRFKSSGVCSGFCISDKLPGGAGEVALPDALSSKASWRQDRSPCGDSREAPGFGTGSPAFESRLHHFPAG